MYVSMYVSMYVPMYVPMYVSDRNWIKQLGSAEKRYFLPLHKKRKNMNNSIQKYI
jgi:hypothetical protein